jgi:starch-binding outer membrane protein, SusD/RagB family
MKIMKLKNILYGLLGFILFGCDSFLDVKPQQSIDANVALTTSENIRLALNASYVSIRNAYGQELLIGADMMADNGEIYFQGTFIEPMEYITKSLVASSTWPEAAWQDAYKGIFICNQVLKNISVADEASRPQIEGEALFLRGLMYFDLARFYAPPYQPGGSNNADAVPLILENSTEMYPARATVAQIYNQAQTDLEKAAGLLDPEEDFFANKYAALAVLSRIYLTKEMWNEAANAASEVIESGLYSLSKTPFTAFNHTSNQPEDVFTFQQNNDDNLGSLQGTGNAGMSAFYASTNVTGRSDFAINEMVFNMYEPDDLRGKVQLDLVEKVSDASDINCMYYNGFINTSSGGIFCAKWLTFDKNMTFVRLAEMYLTRAEANFENGSVIGDTPLNDIKAIRERAGVSTPDAIDLNFIRQERVRELIFEGFRLHDYKRWKWSVGELSYDSPRLVFPVSQRERDVNSNLTQNAGY